jgi:uncharacterized BrkB/YihY/UPF0761 family membrane protein
VSYKKQELLILREHQSSPWFFYGVRAAHIVKMYKDKEVKKNVWRKNIFDIYVTEYGTALTTILPILFLYLNTVIVTAGTFEP